MHTRGYLHRILVDIPFRAIVVNAINAEAIGIQRDYAIPPITSTFQSAFSMPQCLASTSFISLTQPDEASVNPRRALPTEQDIMTKERKSNREDKKKPAMTQKEKKAAKKSKKGSKDLLGIGKTH